MAYAVETKTDKQLLDVAEQYSASIPEIQERVLVENDSDTLEYLVSKLDRLISKQDAVNAEILTRGL